jgi:hypothetical protein
MVSHRLWEPLPERVSLDKPVFQLQNGNPIKTSWMTDKLQHLSVHLGFKILATAYSFRHMVAEALQRNNGKSSW